MYFVSNYKITILRFRHRGFEILGCIARDFKSAISVTRGLQSVGTKIYLPSDSKLHSKYVKKKLRF